MDYEFWNNAIFRYFFYEDNSEKEIFFCVDEDVIKQIGKTHLKEENCMDDFCRVIYEKIIPKTGTGAHLIKLDGVNVNLNQNNIPNQTAIIAFFILAASKMGEDKEYRFSIVAPPSFFKKYLNEIEKISKPQFSEKFKPKSLTDDSKIMILDNLTAYDTSNIINIKVKDEIQFLKGLKIENHNTYMKGAEPKLIINKNNDSHGILFEINGTKDKYENPIDLRQKYNEIGSYYIKTSNNTKKYKIVEIEEKDNNFELIYNQINELGCFKTKEIHHNEPQISGVCIKNYGGILSYNAPKINYIMAILQSHTPSKPFICKDFNNIKNKIMENAQQSNNKQLFYKLNKYFKNKFNADNVELRYLNELKKAME